MLEGDYPFGVGEKTALFAPFIYKMHYFTKTGSGQSLGILKKSGAFSLRQRQRGRPEGRQGAAPAAAPRLGRHRVPAPLPQVLSQSAQAALHPQAERARLLPRGLGRRLVQDGLDGRRGRGKRPAQAERGQKTVYF